MHFRVYQVFSGDDDAFLHRMDLKYLKVRHPTDRHFQKVIHSSGPNIGGAKWDESSREQVYMNTLFRLAVLRQLKLGKIHTTLLFLTSRSGFMVWAEPWLQGLSQCHALSLTELCLSLPAKWAQFYFHNQQMTYEWQNPQALKKISLDPGAK